MPIKPECQGVLANVGLWGSSRVSSRVCSEEVLGVFGHDGPVKGAVRFQENPIEVSEKLQ